MSGGRGRFDDATVLVVRDVDVLLIVNVSPSPPDVTSLLQVSSCSVSGLVTNSILLTFQNQGSM